MRRPSHERDGITQAQEREQIRDCYAYGFTHVELAEMFRCGRLKISLRTEGMPRYRGGFEKNRELARLAGRLGALHTNGLRPRQRRKPKRLTTAQRLEVLRAVAPTSPWRFRYFPPEKDRQIKGWRCWGCSRVNETGKCPCGNVPQWAA